MATDLVRWGYRPDDDDERDEDGVEWDRPPTNPRSSARSGPVYDDKSEFGARRADRDASRAEVRGDSSFAKMREGDAADLRQTRWDWGDLRTWVWITAMCLGFLLFGAFIYFMPQGRHNQSDGPAPTPTIRVY